MYIISNQQMDEILKYIETWQEQVEVTNTRVGNRVRLSQILVKRLKAKQPFSKSELSDSLKKYL